mmetsp:Transcript_40977/g.83700  ORF Transcript_40977/g.83700 Transcript_40977/m.83700 type:complete len:265 (-) Transcript_40977:152-946(-)
MAMETLNISDGTTMQITRLPDIDDETWAEVKTYVESNPDTAKALQNFAKNPDAMRGWLQTQAIAEHYNTKLSNGDTPVQDRVKSLESDAELGPIFEDIKKNGLEAAMKYYQDEELMLKISQKMGGLPSELNPVLQKIEDAAMTLHEAAKRGDVQAVQTFLDKKKPLDSQDYKGITPLGYAIGANRIAVVKLLLDSRANPYAVDSSGNSGLHYAAGYGRKELLEYLLKVGANVNQPNAQGLTPLAAATQNQQEATIQVLKAHGAQ